MIATIHPRAVFGLCLLALSACGEDEERPPPPMPSSGLTNPVTCSQLTEAKPQPGGQDDLFFVGGATAGCVADGLTCPTPWVSCEAGVPNAVCVRQRWTFSCWMSDGGADSGAGGAGGADSGAGGADSGAGGADSGAAGAAAGGGGGGAEAGAGGKGGGDGGV